MDRTRAWLNAFKPAFQKRLGQVAEDDCELLELLRRAEPQPRPAAHPGENKNPDSRPASPRR